MRLNIKKFDISKICKQKNNGCAVFVLGKRATGKTTLARDILWHCRDYSYATAITRDYSRKMRGNTEYRDCLQTDKASYTVDRPCTALINDAIHRQNENTFMEPGIVILDECIWGCDEIMPATPLIYDKTPLKTTSVILMQYPLEFNTNITSAVDYVFIYYTPLIHERQQIFKQYGGGFPSYEVFNTILDVITSKASKYECIVIDNTIKEGGIENRVFWYKAEYHGEFQAGKLVDPNIRQIDI